MEGLVTSSTKLDPVLGQPLGIGCQTLVNLRGTFFYHLLSASLKLSNESARPANQIFSPSLLRVTGHIQWQRQASKTNLFTISSLRHWTYPETAPGQQQTLSSSPLRVTGRIQRQRQASKFLVGAPNLFTVSSSELFSPPLSRHQTFSPSPRRSYFHLPCRGTKPYHHLLAGAIFTSLVETPNLITISSPDQVKAPEWSSRRFGKGLRSSGSEEMVKRFWWTKPFQNLLSGPRPGQTFSKSPSYLQGSS
jgi:hypothetical protein